MSIFISQYSKALKLIPSDDANIPNPYLITEGLTDSVFEDSLICTTAQFQTLNVVTGDVVYNNTTGLSATIVQTVSENILSLNADIFLSSGDSFSIYRNGVYESTPNQGCYIYVGVTGDLDVITSGGNNVLVKNAVQGSVLPLQVVKVNKTGTTATNLLALW